MEEKKIFIDSSISLGTSIAITDRKGKLEDLFFKASKSEQSIKNNIYIATVVRVESSLQAAFINYGSGKNGFLSFPDIHPDYYSLENDEDKKKMSDLRRQSELDMSDSKALTKLHKHFNISDVIKEGQTLVVQVTKDKRGKKGVTLTTYISLAGRYCVFMPNSPLGIGISKKISSYEDRMKLQGVVRQLSVPNGAGLIIRTAGVFAEEEEIKKDYKRLCDIWKDITIQVYEAGSIKLVYSESDLISQVIRDSCSFKVSKIVVCSSLYDEVYESIKGAWSLGSAKITKHDSSKKSVFFYYDIDRQINDLIKDRVDLPSGGYLIINPTEALVAIDVNSGRSKSTNNVEDTAFAINSEAALEISRQLRLRNLGGLFVIDFIDMHEIDNRKKIEEILRKSFFEDKAKIQISRISKFGLLECSRQRIRPSILDYMSSVCSSCSGMGRVLQKNAMLKSITEFFPSKAKKWRGKNLVLAVYSDIYYLISKNNSFIKDMKESFDVSLKLEMNNQIAVDQFVVKEVIRRKSRVFYKTLFVGSGYGSASVMESEKNMKSRQKIERKSFGYGSLLLRAIGKFIGIFKK